MPLSSGLQGAGVLVTGASQGIGYAVAKAFVEEGARVVINSSNAERLQKAAQELSSIGNVTPIVADLSNQAGLDTLVTRSRSSLGRIDTLVYVTRSPKPGVFMEQDYTSWKDAAELLMVSPAYLARQVGEGMVRDGGGRMVFSASVAIREPLPNIATSNVARIAIAGLVRTLARELGSKGVRVNGILPGYIATRRAEEVVMDTAHRQKISVEEARSRLEREIPMGRLGTPEELARAFVFLGSDLSSYVTGALLPVDGGFLHSAV